MPCQPVEAELQNHLGRSRRPSALAMPKNLDDVFAATEAAAWPFFRRP
jgi:hypothetical protein